MQKFWDAARRYGRPLAITAVSIAPILAAAPAAEAQTPLTTVRVASGLSRPVFVDAPRGDFNRLFIVEQRSGSTGRIRILDLRTGQLLATPFLSIPSLSTNDEQGLLGLAFHPNFMENGYFWVYYTAANWSTVVARYRVNGDPATTNVADASSATLVMTFSQPFNNHNGGWIGFGPCGNLFIASGDGGSANDPGNRAQNRGLLLGKMLRIDVDGPDGIPGNEDDDQFPADPQKLYSIPGNNPYQGQPQVGAEEIWAYGLRNPWRCDFDPVTGALFIADVGQSGWEEINYQANNENRWPGDAGYLGGRNYGWRCYEGNAPFNTAGCPAPSTMTFPFLVYGQSQIVPPTNATGCSITGGVVYRGCGIPDLDGTYFFGDYCSNRIFSLRYNGTTISNFQERTSQLRVSNPAGTPVYNGFVSMGRDGYGEVYICSLFNGSVYKIIANSPYYDLNGDGVPDECAPCRTDWNGDGVVNSNDIAAFLSAWLNAISAGTLGGDFDRSGQTNSNDISAFLTAWLDEVTNGCEP